MEPIEEKIFVQHGVDVTFVTFNDEEILAEQHVKELEEEIMTVVEQAKRQNRCRSHSLAHWRVPGFSWPDR